MKTFTTHFSSLLTAVVLILTAILFSADRLEYCGQPDVLCGGHDVATTETAAPTLAPPQNVVFIEVESDHSELQVGWVE